MSEPMIEDIDFVRCDDHWHAFRKGPIDQPLRFEGPTYPTEQAAREAVRDYFTNPPPVPDSLDAAWAEAETALPEGWELTMVGTTDAYEQKPDWQGIAVLRADYHVPAMKGYGPTPTAALRALAAKLREM